MQFYLVPILLVVLVHMNLLVHILLEVKKKMAGRFAKVNVQEIREVLDKTTPKIPCLSI